jgi:cytoskeleton protein RodZ
VFEIGNTLREARVRRGLDISRCEAETKIRAKYLRALEDEEFDVLPAPTYVRGFLRSYAEFLGLDGRLMLDEYGSRFDPEGERVAEERPRRASRRDDSRPPRRPSRRRTEARLLWLAIGGVLAVALLVWLGVGGSGPPPTAIPTSPPSTTPSTPAVAAGRAATRPKKPRRPPPPKGFVVTLVGTGTIGSWVQVRGRGPNGATVYEGILAPGQTYVAPRVPQRLWVRSANPAQLEVQIDGKQIPIDASTPPTNYLITAKAAKVSP